MAKLAVNGTAGNGVDFHMSNKVLAELQRAIEDKFADGRGFWLEYDGTAVWLHPSIPMFVEYDEGPIEFSRERSFDLRKALEEPLGLSMGSNSVASRLKVVDPEWEPPADDEDAEEGAAADQ